MVAENDTNSRDYCEPLTSTAMQLLELKNIVVADLLGLVKRLVMLALGSITGYDYCFESVLNEYYRLKDLVVGAGLYVPRKYREYLFFVDAVEAAIEFEENLADSRRVFLAEPLLAAALKAFCLKEKLEDVKPFYIPSNSSQIFLVESSNGRGKVRVPFPLYVYSLMTISLFYPKTRFTPSLRAGGAIIALDPAYFRDILFREKPPLEKLGIAAVKHLRSLCRKILELNDIRNACGTDEAIVIGYEVEGFKWRTWYICG